MNGICFFIIGWLLGVITVSLIARPLFRLLRQQRDMAWDDRKKANQALFDLQNKRYTTEGK